MSVRIEEVTHEQCWERFIANLEDADLRVAEFLWLRDNACHLNCVEFVDRDREMALREADVWFYLMGENAGLGYAGPRIQPEGLAYWGSR